MLVVIQVVGCFFLDVLQEEGVLRGQDLENAVLDADYTKAIQIAFELHRPHKLFELFAELCRLAMIYTLNHSDVFLFPCFSITLPSILQEERCRQSHRESSPCYWQGRISRTF